MRHRRLSCVAAFWFLTTFAVSAAAGPAIGQFEIKTLAVTPGEREFQSQNAFAFGGPVRQGGLDADGGFVADDNSITKQRYALELEYGVTRLFKTRIGIEFERERLDDASSFADAQAYDALRLDEYALEGIVVLIPRSENEFALGLLVEYEHPAEGGGARTALAGPILEYNSGPWRLSLNPALVKFFGGDRNEDGRRDEKIDFVYTARAMYVWSHELAFAVEAYGAIERVGGWGSKGDSALLFGDFDQHRAGPIVYWTPLDEPNEVTIGTGLLFGLNETTPDATLKLSLEVTF